MKDAGAGGYKVVDGFRWRGVEVSRLEALSDAVFGFALTLLVVSLEVPRTYDQFIATLRGFLSFSLCFGMLLLIWHLHYVFFRRYGMHDRAVMLLNALLLFVTLFFVYPLKFLYNVASDAFFGISQTELTFHQVRVLMAAFGVGFFAVFALFAALYGLALGRRHELELSELETFDTRTSLLSSLISAGNGLAIAAAAPFLILHGAAALPFIVVLAGITRGHKIWRQRQRKRLLAGDAHAPLPVKVVDADDP
jgi:uncharacterized membrane protein